MAMKWNLRSTLFFSSSTPNPNLLLNTPKPGLNNSIKNLADNSLNPDNSINTIDPLNSYNSPDSPTEPLEPLKPPSPDPTSAYPPTQRQLAWKVAPNVFLSFRYAWAGVTYALSTQRNLRIHTIIGAIALGLSWFLQIPVMEVAVIGLTIALVLAMELINTAIESVVDLLVKQSYHELAKIAKDCAAGAVLVAALASVFVAGLLLLPPLYQKLLSMI
jgi:diacylglycerol kinase (ATP)